MSEKVQLNGCICELEFGYTTLYAIGWLIFCKRLLACSRKLLNLIKTI